MVQVALDQNNHAMHSADRFYCIVMVIVLQENCLDFKALNLFGKWSQCWQHFPHYVGQVRVEDIVREYNGGQSVTLYQLPYNRRTINQKTPSIRVNLFLFYFFIKSILYCDTCSFFLIDGNYLPRVHFLKAFVLSKIMFGIFSTKSDVHEARVRFLVD